MEVIADKTEEGYKIRKIQFGGSSEQANEVKQNQLLLSMIIMEEKKKRRKMIQLQK